MKLLALISVFPVALTFAACGGGSSAAGRAGTKRGNTRAVEITGPHGKMKVQIPPGPPPKRLVVKELRKGSGPRAAGAGDEVVVNYAGLDYGTTETFYDSWEQSGPSHFHLKAMRTGWELGLRGMEVGGRRELTVPSRLAYGTGAVVYLVELLGVRPWDS